MVMRVFVPIALCASSLIAGCASGLLSNTSERNDVDSARVASINRVSQNHGVDVYWVNYPQRKALADATPAPSAAPRGDGPSMVLPTGT